MCFGTINQDRSLPVVGKFVHPTETAIDEQEILAAGSTKFHGDALAIQVPGNFEMFVVQFLHGQRLGKDHGGNGKRFFVVGQGNHTARSRLIHHPDAEHVGGAGLSIHSPGEAAECHEFPALAVGHQGGNQFVAAAEFDDLEGTEVLRHLQGFLLLVDLHVDLLVSRNSDAHHEDVNFYRALNPNGEAARIGRTHIGGFDTPVPEEQVAQSVRIGEQKEYCHECQVRGVLFDGNVVAKVQHHNVQHDAERDQGTHHRGSSPYQQQPSDDFAEPRKNGVRTRRSHECPNQIHRGGFAVRFQKLIDARFGKLIHRPTHFCETVTQHGKSQDVADETAEQIAEPAMIGFSPIDTGPKAGQNHRQGETDKQSDVVESRVAAATGRKQLLFDSKDMGGRPMNNDLGERGILLNEFRFPNGQ